MSKLPIYEKKQEILKAINENQVIVVKGPTGCGKTSQLPKILYDAGWAEYGVIACTEPTRIAAHSAASRLAEEKGWHIGNEVGVHVRFENLTSSETRVKFMTEGIIMQEVNKDPCLRAYSVIMVDEVHARYRYTDFLLSYLKSLLPKREDIRIVLSSATINPWLFSRYFGRAPIVSIPPSRHQVRIQYRDDNPKYIDALADEVRKIHQANEKGDVLAFLPGLREIYNAIAKIGNLDLKGIVCLPLYGSMNPSEQKRIFRNVQGRKIIVATNVAETSITIPGIKWVIDSGIARAPDFDESRNMRTLFQKRISQAAAVQRAGRAGRISDGVCIRLYSKASFERQSRYSAPDIMRADLTDLVLASKAYGVRDLSRLDLPTPAPIRAVARSEELLKQWGALDEEGNLTKFGSMLHKIPLDPELSRMVLLSQEYGCTQEVIVIASFLSVRDIFLRGIDEELLQNQQSLSDKGGDFVTFLNIWRQYSEAKNPDHWCRARGIHPGLMQSVRYIVEQVIGKLQELEIPVFSSKDPEIVNRAMANMLKHNLCVYYRNNTYRCGVIEGIRIAPASALASQMPLHFVTFNFTDIGRISARYNAEVRPEWIKEQDKEAWQVIHQPYLFSPLPNAGALKLKGALRVTRGTNSRLVRLNIDLGKIASQKLDIAPCGSIVAQEDSIPLEMLPLSESVKNHLSLRGIANFRMIPKSRYGLRGIGFDDDRIEEIMEILRDFGFVPRLPKISKQNARIGPERKEQEKEPALGVFDGEAKEDDWLMAKFLQKPVADLDVSSGARIRLAGLADTIADLIQKTEKELLRVLNHDQLAEVTERLALYDLSLNPEDDSSYSFLGFAGMRKILEIDYTGQITEEEAEKLHEENYELLRAYRNAQTDEERIAIRNEIATKNIRLAWKVSDWFWHHPWELRNDKSIEPDDLFIEGSVGLLRAIESFDYTRGFRFSTYAFNWILRCARRLIDNLSMLPVYQVENARRLLGVISRYRNNHEGKNPPFEHLVEKLKQKPETVQYWLDRVAQFYNHFAYLEEMTDQEGGGESKKEAHILNLLTYDEDGVALAPDQKRFMLFDSVEEQEREADRRELMAAVDHMIQTANLLVSERRMLELYFGLSNERDHTLEEISPMFGVTRERIRQLIESSLAKLRTPEIWEQARAFFPYLQAPMAHQSFVVWQKGADCFKDVLRQCQPDWQVPDFVSCVSGFFGLGPDEVLSMSDYSPSERKDMPPELRLARDLLVSLLYNIGGLKKEIISFWTGQPSGGIDASLERVRKGFKAIGEIYLLDSRSKGGDRIEDTRRG